MRHPRHQGKNSSTNRFGSLARLAILSAGISGAGKVVLEKEQQLLNWGLERHPKVFLAVVVVQAWPLQNLKNLQGSTSARAALIINKASITTRPMPAVVHGCHKDTSWAYKDVRGMSLVLCTPVVRTYWLLIFLWHHYKYLKRKWKFYCWAWTMIYLLDQIRNVLSCSRRQRKA